MPKPDADEQLLAPPPSRASPELQIAPEEGRDAPCHRLLPERAVGGDVELAGGLDPDREPREAGDVEDHVADQHGERHQEDRAVPAAPREEAHRDQGIEDPTQYWQDIGQLTNKFEPKDSF